MSPIKSQVVAALAALALSACGHVEPLKQSSSPQATAQRSPATVPGPAPVSRSKAR